MTKFNRLLAPVALISAMAAVPVFAQTAPVPTPEVSISDAVVRGGNSLEFADVKMDQAGWIVISEGAGGVAVGPSLTQRFVNPGAHSNVLVPLKGGFQAGKEYIISVHYDTNGNGTWDNETDPAVDGPVIRTDGTPYVVPFLMQAAN